MVFDVPAESGGAISVLYDFYDQCKVDEENDYIFVVSIPELNETNNIKAFRFPWIKKSWFHRLFFDHFLAPGLICKNKVDKILSLQNVIVPHTRVYQSLFVHNALPFSEHLFSFRDDRFLWVYQNIIGRSIKRSIKKADSVIVQTNWMKKKLIEQLNISAKKIEILQPKVDIVIKEHFQETKESISTFFYPANGVAFKNHRLIVGACLKLKEDKISNYRIILTLCGNENKKVKQLHNVVIQNKLPIEFVGNMTKSRVFELYTKSVLVFPSYVETVGLPLLEARMHRTPILVSDCEYAHEVLVGYEHVEYFNPFDDSSLKKCFISKLKG